MQEREFSTLFNCFVVKHADIYGRKSLNLNLRKTSPRQGNRGRKLRGYLKM